MAIIIIRPFMLGNQIQTSNPYMVEATEKLEMRGQTNFASMQIDPNEQVTMGAQVAAIDFAIMADDSGHVNYGLPVDPVTGAPLPDAAGSSGLVDRIGLSGGIISGAYTISAAYGNINGGTDKLKLSGGIINNATLVVTAGYVTYSRMADAITMSGGIINDATLVVTAGYVTYNRMADALTLSGGIINDATLG